MTLLFSCLLALAPAAPPTDTLPYNLHNPILTVNLVDSSLQEISALSPTHLPDVYVAMSDERGELFFVNVENGGMIVRRTLFRDKGDFEGVEMVTDNCIFAMKSDGELFEISNWDKATPKVREYKTPLKKSDDLEGLCYDKARKALLLASKSDPDNNAIRKVYAFDLKKKKIVEQPVYQIDPEEVNRILPRTEDEKRYFSPSGIAVHPQTGDIYITSTSLKRLVVLDRKGGNIKWVARLDKKLMPQPEGIAFDKAGNLMLCSEGKKGEGLILQFAYKPAKN